MAGFPARIAVTGAAGFLGRHTVAWLAGLNATERILAIDVAPAPRPPDPGAVITVQRDIREPVDDLLRAHGIRAVIHLAYVLRPSRDRAAARAVNVDATESLLKACAVAGVRRVVYPSSTTVYGAYPTFSRPYAETDPVRPVRGFQYSEDKVAAERLLSRFAAENPSATVAVLRGCVVMGPAAHNFILEALTMRWLPVPAFSNPPMQFLHVSDLLDVFHAALEHGVRGTFNVAGGGVVRWRQMVALFGNRAVPVPGPLLQRLTGLTWALRLQNRSPASGVNYIRYPWLASTEKIERELGWRARFTSEDALLAAREPETPRAGRD